MRTKEYNREYMREYRKKESWKKYKREHMRLWRMKKKNKFKENVRRKISYRVVNGLLKRCPCEVCGNPKTQAHHSDYRKFLQINWLCQTHHTERDYLEGKRK